MNGVVWFTALDFKSGCWQFKVDEASEPLMAFTAAPLGFYKCDHMPFRLVNAPGETCPGDLQLISCLTHLDDVIVFSKTPENHLVWLRAVFEKQREAGLKLKPSKWVFLSFFKKSLAYLGHRISEQGVETDDSKIKVLQEWPTPKTVTEVRSFLGFTNYYWEFIYKYAQVFQPWYKLILGENVSK